MQASRLFITDFILMRLYFAFRKIFLGSHGIGFSACISVCGSNIIYIWISLDPAKAEQTRRRCCCIYFLLSDSFLLFHEFFRLPQLICDIASANAIVFLIRPEEIMP